MVDGGFFMTVVSGNGKRQSRPAFVERMRQQKFPCLARSGKPGICQLVSVGNLRKTIFDTFPYCILVSSQAVMTVGRIELLCD